MRLGLVLLLAFALVSMAPSAGAHISAFSQARSLTLGPYLAYLDPTPSDGGDLYANSSLSFSALISNNDTGNYVTDATAKIVMHGPGGWTKSVDMAKDASGYLLASMILPFRGNYSADFILTDRSGHSYSAPTSFTAYPVLPFRIRSADTTQDISARSLTTIAIEEVDPITGARVDKFSNATLSIERWATDHSKMLDQQVVTPKHDGRGLWKYDYAFPQPGMYHLRLASVGGGFNYDDVPLLHTYATDPALTASSPEGHKVPAPGLALSFVVVALALFFRRARR